MQLLIEMNQLVNQWIWGIPAMASILGVGMYLSYRTGFLQISRFGRAMQVTLGRIFRKKEARDGALTPFQAVCTALAATIGTGNIAGVAGNRDWRSRSGVLDVVFRYSRYVYKIL